MPARLGTTENQSSGGNNQRKPAATKNGLFHGIARSRSLAVVTHSRSRLRIAPERTEFGIGVANVTLRDRITVESPRTAEQLLKGQCLQKFDEQSVSNGVRPDLIQRRGGVVSPNVTRHIMHLPAS